MPSARSVVRSTASRLQNTQAIIIDDANNPYHVEHSLLDQASAWDFADRDHDATDPYVCELILHYIVKKSLPALDLNAASIAEVQKYVILLTEAWCVAEACCMKQLMNAAMGKLLELGNEEQSTGMDAIWAAFEYDLKEHYGPSNPLRKFMAEQLVLNISRWKSETYEALCWFEEIGGLSEVAHAMAEFHNDESVWEERAGEEKRKEYMV